MWWPFKRKVAEPSRFDLPVAIGELDAERRYTPDMARLEMLEYHFLFVCGEMQKYHHQQEEIALDERTGWEAFTQVNFHLLMSDLGRMSHPLLFHDLNPMPRIEALPVKGEIVRLSPRRFLALDKYYHNTVRFQRLPVMLVVPFSKLLFNDRRQADILFGPHLQSADVKKRGVYRVWAHTYFAPKSYWFDLLTDYNNPPVKAFENPDGLIKKYYRFTVDQYDPPFDPD